MSVPAFGDPESLLLAFLGKYAQERCFWCSKPLADRVVFWHGHGHDCGAYLALHHGCAEELGIQLIHEAQRALSITLGQSALSGIDAHWHAIAGSAPE
jgi:hypothetical protein